MPSVSIIVPVHDAGSYVAECLASIECQTLSDIEVICIDDASSDDSLAVCRAFAAEDGRFKVIALEENEGVASVRNRGLDLAIGDFVMFMDADDWYPSCETVEHLYRAAVDHGVSIAGGEMSEYDVTTGLVFDDYRDLGHLALYNFDEAGVVDYRDWQGDYGFTRFIYERKLIDDNDIRFPALVRHEDPVFFVEAMIAAGAFYALPEAVYCYRVKHKSYDLDDRAIDDAVEAHIRLFKLADENDLPVLKGYVTETLRWYLSTQTPEARALQETIDELVQEVEAVYNSTTYRLGNVFAKPWRRLMSLRNGVR